MINALQKDVATESGVSESTIKNIERDEDVIAQGKTAEKLKRYFTLKGIELRTDGSVGPIGSKPVILKGHEGFSDFLDDVYETAVNVGSVENPCQIFLSNVLHSNWTKWMGPEKWKSHTSRMTRDKDLMDVRILVQEGDLNFPAQAYSKYKFMPKHKFRDKSFYSYHDRLAFLDFREDSVTVTIIRQLDFAEGYRNHFLDTWDYVAINPLGTTEN